MQSTVVLIKKYLQNRMIKAFHDSEEFLTGEVSKFSGSEKLRILDVGCGDGKLTMKMLGGLNDPDIYGIDMLDRKKVDPTIKYLKTNLETEPFPFTDNYFDVVMSNQVIEHILDKDRFLSECFRVLKGGGLFICCTDNIASWDNIISLLFGQEPLSQHTGSKFVTNSFLSPYFMNKMDDSSGNTYSHKNVCSYYGLRRLLKIAGFKDVKMKTYGNLCGVFEALFPIYNRLIVISSIKCK